MPPEYDDLIDLVRALVENMPDDIEVLDFLQDLQLPLSWPAWSNHIGGEQDLLRLIQQVRAGGL